MKLNRQLLVCVLLGVSMCSSYRILAIFPFNGRSHFRVLEQVAKALAEKGHQVDVISSFPLKETFPNYNDIIKLPNANKFIDFDYEMLKSRSVAVENLHQICRDLCQLLGHPDISNLIKNPPTDRPYDLIITHYLSAYQCFAAIGHLWNVPVVGVVTTALYAFQHSFIGAPLNLAIASKNYYFHKENMNFWERFINTLGAFYSRYEYHSEAYKQDAIIKKHLGPNIPHYTELEKSVALILTNSHYSLHGVQPKVPAHIEIGGIHVGNDNTTLTPELKKLLDESTDGFIYFSFGTLIRIETLPKDIIAKLYNIFRKISPVRIIMKSQKPENMPKNKPDNLFMLPWLPQQKIFQHPNIKGFLSHGGGLGTQEAVYYGVPILCVPFFADQFVNCDITVNKKIGLKFDLQSDQEMYEYVFNEILSNITYKNAAKQFSTIFRDRAMKQKDEVAYWLEYVIRHGKNVLRSPAVDMPWWQVELLDIYGFILACFLITVVIIFFLLQHLYNLTLSASKFMSRKSVALSKKTN